MKWNQAGFAHFVIVGTDGAFGACPGPPGTWDFDILGVNLPAFGWHDQPQSFDWFRFGGELVLPFVTGGIYLNVGQLVDGVAGIATWDPAADDRATELEREGRTEALRADQPVTPAPAEP